MASHRPHLLLLLLMILSSTFLFSYVVPERTQMYTFPCSSHITTCNSSLYHVAAADGGLSKDEVASYYSVHTSQMKPVAGTPDYLITVPCSCQPFNNVSSYFYDVSYAVRKNDSFSNVNNDIYSGQAMIDEEDLLKFKKWTANDNVTLHILCGCIASKSQTVVTYTVQEHDTLSTISSLLIADVNGIESLNRNLTINPEFIVPGDVLFVPMEKSGRLPSPKAKFHNWTIVIIILSAVTLITIGTLIIVLLKRRRNQQKDGEDPKNHVLKSVSSHRVLSTRNQYLHNGTMEDMTAFESDRPAVFSLEEIEASTKDFDETRIIGTGGYGCVYYGVLEGKEVAIKKMRSNKSKEFFAELKVLCKIHHINVVELLGYASGDDHLYLVYEFVHNGSLSAHLHDPLTKGHQPLSWSARTQIAVDAARGIEYIHDHTKARYVHRDIKTANILLDERLRGKVADFGLVKLVGTNENDLVATRLVGTPGYLPPESVKELQVTTKTDVFAFGVVLAELITGKRALVRNNHEPNKTRSLITTIKNVFESDDPEAALEAEVDKNLGGNYPIEDVMKMAEIADWCLSEEAFERPEINEIIVPLTQIMIASTEWEASLGGNTLDFSGLSRGR